MTPERWKQIGDLYYETSLLPEGERCTFLENACAGDEELRREVELLLDSEENVRSFIESSPDDVAAGMIFARERGRSMIGRTLGRYHLHSLIGKGGMGEVYLASDTRLDRKVAVKTLLEHLASNEEALLRFEREAKAVAALSHRNILSIHDLGQDQGVTYAVMELLEGETLRTRLQRGALDWREALEVTIAVAEGLEAAHAAGIVHRDLKPANIFLTSGGQVKVLDFGIARIKRGLPSERNTNETTVTDETKPGTVLGTVGYMSPEQVRGEEADAPSDIFALGCVLYEMITCHKLFARANTMQTLAAILSDDPPAVTKVNQAIPKEIERIIGHSLEKEPRARYQSGRELADDLRALLAGESPQNVIAASPVSQESLREHLEPIGGAVPLDSKYYIDRPIDHEFQAAIARQDSIVLVKGARQVGKTSLLARGLQQARRAEAKVIMIDFQELATASFQSVETLMLTLAESFAEQLELDVLPHQVWKPRLSPGSNFERYLRRVVFDELTSAIVWGMDEVDRLFNCDFGSEVFGLFRAWHNKRALDPEGPWRRFTLAIAYATEAHLFITDLNQSPFNVGTRLTLDDFTFNQVADLNQRYGSPLHNGAEAARYFRLVGGHPYLVRRGLHEMVTNNLNLTGLEARAAHDEGPFGDHLRRLLISLTQDDELCNVVRGVLHGQPCPSPESFYRLRSAGLLSGDSARDVRPRCQLYATYLEEHLL